MNFVPLEREPRSVSFALLYGAVRMLPLNTVVLVIMVESGGGGKVLTPKISSFEETLNVNRLRCYGYDLPTPTVRLPRHGLFLEAGDVWGMGRISQSATR